MLVIRLIMSIRVLTKLKYYAMMVHHAEKGLKTSVTRETPKQQGDMQ